MLSERGDRIAGWVIVSVVVLVVLVASPGLGFVGTSPSGAATSAPHLLTASELRSGPYETEGGQGFPGLATATPVGPVPVSTSIYFTVSFALSHPQALATLVQQQQTPGSPQYHQFLTAAQFDQRFGPPTGLAQETVAYFTSFGATAVSTGSPFTVAFRANPTQIGEAFRTSLESYRFPNGSVGFVNAGPLSLPRAIGNYVSSIDGLSDFQSAQSDHMHAPFGVSNGMRGSAAVPAGVASANMSRAANWTTPGFLYATIPLSGSSPYQFLTPAAMTVAYNATALYNLGDLGQGTTIAVVMASGYNPSDLATYAQETFGNPNQILNRLTAYPVAGTGGNASPPGTTFLSNGLAFEFTLDIEYSATMAPRAHIDAVYGPGLDNPSLVSVYALISNLTPAPNVVTNSWGGSEDAWWNLVGPTWQSAAAMENYWEQMTAEGMTILASTGDDGGWDSETGFLSAGLPATSPYVTAVGGTGTTVANATGVEFPTPQYTVNVTVAPYGNSEARSWPGWFPNMTLDGANISKVVQERYWVTVISNGTAPNYAGGTLGLSYWFQQPWWQHGPGIPDTGRRMNPDISAEADFNETVYFDGAWDFFWGGTSFACPTVAGEIALLDAYLNSTLGPTPGDHTFYSGLLGPLLYALGNDQNLTQRVYAPITVGANKWDLNALAQGSLFPPGQNWPVKYMSASPGWNLLVGWGVPNIGTLATEAAAIDAPPMLVTFANGTVVATAVAGASYTLTLVDNSPGHPPVAGATVQMWFTPSSITPVAATETTAVTSGTGTFSFDATGSGYLAIYAQFEGATTFQSIWFSPAPASGILHVAVVDAPATMMGGFEVFNGLLSPPYPAIGPIEPNVLMAKVTWQADASATPVPIYNAAVVASSPVGIDFSSPPDVESPYFNYSLLTPTPLASLSWTNLTGIAYVDTWNEPSVANYTITATYDGLSASTVYNITPQLDIGGVGPLETFLAQYYSGVSGYIGLGAQDTVVAPSVTGGATYQLPVEVTNWTGVPQAHTMVDLALPPYAPPYTPTPIPGTAAVTGPNGVANLTINAAIASFGAAFGGELLVEAYNASYTALTVTTYVGSVPLRWNASSSFLLFIGPASASVQMEADYGTITTNYVGTVGAVASFDVSVPPPAGPYSYNNITTLTYAVDAQAPIPVPLGPVGTSSYYWAATLPTLTVGAHSLTVTFTDAMGFTYTDTQPFWVIGPGPDPSPSVTFVSPAPQSYLSGNVSVGWTSDETPYLADEELTVSAGTFEATYDVTGMSSFVLPTSSFSSGPVLLSINVTNVNGLVGSNVLTFNVGNELTPSASLLAPSSGSTVPVGTNVTIVFAYSGDYLSAATLTITTPTGAQPPVNVTGTSSYVLTASVAGSYSMTLMVTSHDGRSASASDKFSAVEIPQVLSVSVSPPTASLLPGGEANLTATASCSPSPCPAGLTWTWASATASPPGTLTSSGPTAQFTAGTTAGSALIIATATLNGHSIQGSAAISVQPTPTVTTTSSSTNYPLWIGIIVAAAVVAFALGALIMRNRRRPGPTSVPSSVLGPSPPVEPPSEGGPGS